MKRENKQAIILHTVTKSTLEFFSPSFKKVGLWKKSAKFIQTSYKNNSNAEFYIAKKKALIPKFHS